MKIPTSIVTEFMKLRRSKIVWLSFLFYVFFALMSWFVLWIVKNPGAAQGLGLIGQKASFASMGMTADWKGLFAFFAELGTGGGWIVCSILVIFVFGREYAEGTAKNMLALPIPRAHFVWAKLFVTLLWFILLTIFLVVESLIVGKLLGLGTLPKGFLVHESGNLLLSSLLVFALQPLVAWITIASGGYLAPFGYTLATLIIANLMIRTEWARWIPWSIVAVLSGFAGPRQSDIVLGSGLILALTFAAGSAITVLWLRRADNTQ
jgi:ABC-2 type transport system permease protein